MKRKTLCIALALVMCLMVMIPTIADSKAEALEEKAEITASFGLKHISGSTYRMWAKINNLTLVSVYARLTLYDASYNQIESLYTTSSNIQITLSKNISLSSGTYHLKLSYTAGGVTQNAEKTYII